MTKEFEPYSNVLPIKDKELEVIINETHIQDYLFEKYRGFVDVKEGVLYLYNEPEEVEK